MVAQSTTDDGWTADGHHPGKTPDLHKNNEVLHSDKEGTPRGAAFISVQTAHPYGADAGTHTYNSVCRSRNIPPTGNQQGTENIGKMSGLNDKIMANFVFIRIYPLIYIFSLTTFYWSYCCTFFLA